MKSNHHIHPDIDDTIHALISGGIEVDNHEARDWLAGLIGEALEEAKAVRSVTDEDERPAHRRRIAALTDLLDMVRTYQTTAPLIEKTKLLCIADRARGLRADTLRPLSDLGLDRPQDDLDWWLNGWTDWAISAEDLAHLCPSLMF